MQPPLFQFNSIFSKSPPLFKKISFTSMTYQKIFLTKKPFQKKRTSGSAREQCQRGQPRPCWRDCRRRCQPSWSRRPRGFPWSWHRWSVTEARAPQGYRDDATPRWTGWPGAGRAATRIQTARGRRFRVTGSPGTTPIWSFRTRTSMRAPESSIVSFIFVVLLSY